MNDFPRTPDRASEVLSVIADALTRQPSNHATEHFPSIRARTRRLNKYFENSIQSFDSLITEWKAALGDNEAVADAFKCPNSPREPFRRIAPNIISNFQRIAHTLVKETRPPEPAETPQELDKVAAKFDDFINLGSVVRQYTDSMVETSYQVCSLDAAKFNYKFLESLVSFAPVAPASLHQTLYSDALQAIVSEFASMSGRDRKRSTFSRNEHTTFPGRAKWLTQHLSINDGTEQSLNKIFKFCSDFVHLGYASSVALGTASSPQIVMGAGDYFTAPTLNYAELRLILLAECARYYAEVFVPALVFAFKEMLVDSDGLVARANELRLSILDIRNYVGSRMSIEFFRDGLIGSDQQIKIECGRCGEILKWAPPHRIGDCYCEGCGLRLQVEVVPEAVDYIVSCEGFSKVNGSDAAEIADLSAPLKEKLEAIRQRHVPNREGEALPWVRVTDLERLDVETLDVPAICTSRPGPEYDGQFTLIAYAASKALERQASVIIACNCGAKVNYEPAIGNSICHCTACGASIGIFGVSGDAAEIPFMDAPGGEKRFAPIHGARSMQSRNDQLEGLS